MELSLLAVSVAVVAGLAWFERRSGARGGDWRVNALAWLVNIAAGFCVYTVLSVWHGPALIRGKDLPMWLAVLLFIIVQDLAEYLFHRAQHKVPILWAMHSLHHSDPEMSALTTTRHFWGDRAVKTVTVWSAAAMVVAPTGEAIVAYAVVSFWNYLSHANVPIDFGRWSWVINSPAYHRRHHSSLPEHYDSNFAALFPIFDVLSGAYNRPNGYPPTGLDHRPRSLRDLLLWPVVDKAEKASEELNPA